MTGSGFGGSKYSRDVPFELQKLHPSALPKTYSFTNAVGAAKGHPYLPIGRHVAGPDHSNRHGPRRLVPTRLEGVWRGSGPLGRSIPNDRSPMSTISSVTSVPVVAGSREWHDPKYNGVSAAAAYAQYVSSGAHKIRPYADAPKPAWMRKPKKKQFMPHEHGKSHITFR